VTDQEHAKAIREMVDSLNVAIHAAHADGLRVDVDYIETCAFGDRYPLQLVIVTVLKGLS